ncbi:MAG TPA: hypothetical protein VL984_11095 [Acidimicrobiales bacterium]|nr:hypothetical protein [Acidimicrobiales bacterium]
MRSMLTSVVAAAMALGLPNAAEASGTTTTTTVPSHPALQVAGDWMGACALVRGGEVECWGYNPGGQQGDGTTVTTMTPVAVTGVRGATSVASGGQSNCAVVAGGRVKCWGQNQLSNGATGQLGAGGSEDQSLVPVAVHGLSGVRTLVGDQLNYGATGGYCAITYAGKVWCWGENDGVGMAGGPIGNGDLGNGSDEKASGVPVQVKGLTAPAESLAPDEAGWCALLVTGHVECWGDNQYNELGDGHLGSLTGASGNGIQQFSDIAVPVLHLTGAVSITAARATYCAVTRTSVVWCWGGDSAGTLGDGHNANPAENYGSDVPVRVLGLANVKSLASNTYTYCALLTNGNVRCWGSNGDGNLGNGDLAENYSDAPVLVKDLGGVKSLFGAPGNGPNGQVFCVTLEASPRVKCWGGNGFGMVASGNSQANFISPPQFAVGMTAVKSIVLGTSGEIAFALATDGAVWWWGNQDPKYATPQPVPAFGPGQ